MNNNEEFCPQCPNHCPKSNLACGRGRAYFGEESGGKPTHFHKDNFDENSITSLIQRCGHYLHHSANEIDEKEFCQNLTQEEQTLLKNLLKKLKIN